MHLYEGMLFWQLLFRGFGMGKLNGATNHTLLLMLTLAGAACGPGASTSSTPTTSSAPSPTASAPGSANAFQGQIAFESNRDGDFEIYVMGADGTALENLTDDPADDFQPAWSPDGTKIAFASDRVGADVDLYVMNADGSGVERLAHFPGDETHPVWSPDGTKIALLGLVGLAFSELDVAEIYVMNADGTDLDRIDVPIPGEDPTYGGFTFDSAPSWSPDGVKIAFVGDFRLGGVSNIDIYVMNPDGTGLERLTDDQADDADPEWSPDGTKIAFHSDRDGDFEIYVMNADGTNVAQVTDDPAADLFPSWSPDGTALAFASDRDGNPEIYVMGADGTGVIRLTSTGLLGEDVGPVWSPTGGMSS